MSSRRPAFRRLLAGRASAVVLVAALGAGSAGCSTTRPAAAVVSTRDGGGRATRHRVDRASFDRELRVLAANQALAKVARSHGTKLGGGRADTIDARLAAGWLDFVVNDLLLAGEFDRRHLTITPDERSKAQGQLAGQFGSPDVAGTFPAWFRDRIIGRDARAAAVEAAVESDARSTLDLSDAGLLAWYNGHLADYSDTCESHILVPTRVAAEVVEARLRAGEDFAVVARAVSIDPGSRKAGGDLGCTPSGTLVPAFEDAAAAATIGVPTRPVHTQFGWHVILVRSRTTESFAAARDEVLSTLQAKIDDAFPTLLAALAGEATITVDPRYGRLRRPAVGPAGTLALIAAPAVPNPRAARTDSGPTGAPGRSGPPSGPSGG